MEDLKIQAVVDESSFYALVESGKLPTNFNPQNIEWKVGEVFRDGDDMVVPIYAVGYKVAPSENRLSDEEFRQAWEQLSRGRLSDLCVESTHADCQRRPCLEIPSSRTPDWQPRLHK